MKVIKLVCFLVLFVAIINAGLASPCLHGQPLKPLVAKSDVIAVIEITSQDPRDFKIGPTGTNQLVKVNFQCKQIVLKKPGTNSSFEVQPQELWVNESYSRIRGRVPLDKGEYLVFLSRRPGDSGWIEAGGPCADLMIKNGMVLGVRHHICDMFSKPGQRSCNAADRGNLDAPLDEVKRRILDAAPGR